jgi:hypothetical protein
MFSCNPAAYEQHHEIFSANPSVDSAAHCGLSVQSFYSSRFLRGCEGRICQTRLPSPALSSRLTPQQPHWFSTSPRRLFHARMLGP